MKVQIKIVLSLMITILLCSFFHVAIAVTTQTAIEQAPTLIPINKEMIHDENISQITQTFIRKADVLVDEQDKLPTTPQKEIEKETFDKISTDTWHPSNIGSTSCYIDLKATYQISHIGYKDTFGNPTIIFSSGSPFHWNEIAKQTMNSYNTWNLIPVSAIQTRYLQLKIESGTDAGISEIAIYGYKISEEEPEKEINTTNPDFGITIDQSVGTNAFIDDPFDVLKGSGVIREYHNLRWVLDQNRYQNKFNPSYGGKWDFDAYYKMLHDANIVVSPCIQGTSKALTNSPKSFNEKPIWNGANPQDPASYKEHASTMFQYAARYGSQTVDSSKLLLASDQEKKSGLGYLTYYENSNEPDKTWEGEQSYFSPYELAAMCSSDYDGHEKTLGDTYGIKNADPNAKLVMGGLCQPASMPQYLDLMKLWFENNRADQKLAFDVINFHSYCGDKSPEEAGFKQTCEAITAWRNANARDKEVWLTEFGWDSNQSSPLHAPNNETQRDWLVRSCLIAEAAGVDRSTMYMIRDTSWEGNPGKYGTSGLTTEKGAWKKKPSWYGLYNLKDTLAGYEFKQVAEESDNIYIYEFIEKSTGKTAYALWCPTSNGSKLENYQFEVGNKTKPSLVKLSDGYYDGEKTKLKVEDGKVTFNVTESPVLLMLDSASGSYETPSNTKIDISKATLQIAIPSTENKKEEEIEQIKQNMLTNYQSLFDEQQNAPIAPKMNFNGSFATGWGNINIGKNYPATAILDLKEEQQITSIGLYDTTAVGVIKFYAGTPEKWEDTPFLECTLNTYKTWRNFEGTAKTRYIKIVKEDSAELSEIAFYGYTIASDQEDPNKALNGPPSVEVQKDRLDALIKQAKSYQEKDYTKDSWNVMQQALQEANIVLSNSEATQEMVDQAYENLAQSIQQLVKVEIPNPDPTPTPDPEPDPDPTPTPDPEPDPEPDPTPTPDPTPEPEPDPDPTPTPDPTPMPKPTPGPVVVPDGSHSDKNSNHNIRDTNTITNRSNSVDRTLKLSKLPMAGENNHYWIFTISSVIVLLAAFLIRLIIKKRKEH